MSFGAVNNEPLVAGDVVLWEVGAEFEYAREVREVTLADGAILECGQVMEGDGALAIDANADGVLLTRCVNLTGAEITVNAVVLVNLSIVNKATLSDAGVAVLAALAALGVQARDEADVHAS